MNESSLAHALRFGSADDVLSLLLGGENPMESGQFHISSEGFEEKIEALLAHGWDIDQCQLLHDANHGFGKRVEFYLSQGANPRVKDQNGQNALHKFGALGIGVSAIEALVAAGADLHAEDVDGHTPLDLAKRAKRDSAFKAITRLLTV